MHRISLWNEKWGKRQGGRLQEGGREEGGEEAKDSRGALNPQRGFIMQEKEHNNHPK